MQTCEARANRRSRHGREWIEIRRTKAGWSIILPTEHFEERGIVIREE
jgi:hypothetical protein